MPYPCTQCGAHPRERMKCVKGWGELGCGSVVTSMGGWWDLEEGLCSCPLLIPLPAQAPAGPSLRGPGIPKLPCYLQSIPPVTELLAKGDLIPCLQGVPVSLCQLLGSYFLHSGFFCAISSLRGAVMLDLCLPGEFEFGAHPMEFKE